MFLGGNFATVNHLLINYYLLEAFNEVFSGKINGNLVYYISHNIIREEIVDNRKVWVHRKGATRAMPGNHHEVIHTQFAGIGHPIILPGNCTDGTVIMRGNTGAKQTMYSVNHGAGRRMGRRRAKDTFDQKLVNNDMLVADVLYNDRNYPIDESPRAYKDFKEVIDSVVKADLATRVATLKPRFVIKDADKTSQEG
jgi:tRNA-splicing ligase RtcB